SRFRPTARKQSQAASTRPRSAGRCRRTRPSRCCASMTARSTRWPSSPTAGSPPAARMRASRSGRRARRSRRWCLQATQRLWSRDGATLASASWDHTARLWPLAGGAPRVIEGHAQNVNGVAFAPDGRALVTAAYDATLRISPLLGGAAPVITTLPTPLNTVAVAPDGEIVTAGADGKVYVLSTAGKLTGEIEAGRTPIIAQA